MPCDPVVQVSSDLVGPLGTQRIFSTHQYPRILFREIRLLSNEAKKAGVMIMHESLHKNLQRSSNKAYARSCKELYHQTAARDVMDAAARSRKVTLIP